MAETDVLRVARERVGRVLRGKYRLERVIGVGGMAAVYAATHRNNKQFAVKLLHPELSMRDDIRTRFLREGYVANSVKHPGAVAVMDDDVAEDGSAFLVMELLEGAQVNDLWARHGRTMPLGVVLAIGDALLEVLAAAHSRGIVHRDIKPPNLFVTCDGVLKVLDFGIARLLDDAGPVSATVTGTLMGTPAYMAPEQALAKASEVDAQTDLWAVGATMFSLLGGELVHSGDNASQLLVNAATQPARSLSTVVKDAAPAIATVVDKALAFEKTARWATASAMREALLAACIEATGKPIPPLPKPDPEPVDAATTKPAGSGGNWTDAAFAPTVHTGDREVAHGVTTAGPVATTQGSPGHARGRLGWRRAALGIAGALAIGGAVGSYRAAHVPRATYCAFVTDGRDGPRCGLSLSREAAAKRRGRTVRLTEVGGRVRSVDWVNLERSDSDDDDLYREDFVRDDSGEVVEVTRRDPHGAVLRREKWQREPDGSHRIDLVDLDGMTPRLDPHTSISMIRRAYDGEGRVARETYFGRSGRPRANAEGQYGLAFEYGKLGRWTKETVLAADGQPGADTRGRSVYLRSDDETPVGRDAAALDANGQPMTVEGVYRVSYTFDPAFDVMRRDVFGLYGEPTVNVVSGSHSLRETWAPARHVVEVTALDEHDRPRPPKGESAAVQRTTYDEHGRPILFESVDANGNRTRRRGDGVSATRLTWTAGDDELLREYLDPNGMLMLGDGSYARRRTAYDSQGNTIERRYFDEAGQPTSWKEGGAIERDVVDERGLTVRVSQLDGDERPIFDVHGVHETRRKYDRARNKIEEAYFDVDGRPTVNEDGVSIVRSTYDDNDDLTRAETFDEAGSPVMLRGEHASERFTYDDRGLVSSAEALDAHGDRALREEGYASTRMARDRNGDIVSEAYFGKHDELVAGSLGYARKTMKYDARRRVIETALFDASGSSTMGVDAWAIERTTYDDRGLVTRQDYFDSAGKPIAGPDHGASVVKKWDARGNLVEETSLGVDGNPRVTERDGYATRKSEYDDHDRLQLSAALGADGKPTAGIGGVSVRRLRYDEVGNVVEEAYFDGERAPVAPKGVGYASVRYTLDARQRLVETSFFDTAGAPGGPDGVATVRYKRDTYGRATETAYFDRNGSPTSKEGRATLQSSYDAAGRPILERFYDAAGALAPSALGCAGYRMKYDVHGRKTETACLSTSEEPTMSIEGFAIQRTVHDGRGNDVDVSTWGPSGLPCVDKEGIARRHNRYDDRNLLVASTYFDASDKPARDKRGVHETRFAYSENGKALTPSYFDEDAKPVVLDGLPAITVDAPAALPLLLASAPNRLEVTPGAMAPADGGK